MSSVATIFNVDFYAKFRPKASDREHLLVMRIAAVVAGAIATAAAIFMATLNLRSLFQVWNELFAVLGGGFLGIYILGIFTRRANAIGAATGALMSVVVTVLVRSYTTLHWYGYMPAAVFSCCIIGYLVSLVTPRSSRSLAGLTAFDVKRSLAPEKAAEKAEVLA
jgi:Na+/proline symporter